MALVWFYQSPEGKKNGPFGNRQLKNLAIEGKITPNTLVWKNGMKKWKPASAVVGLFGEKYLNSLNETPPKMPTSIAGIPEWYYLLNGKRNGPVMIGVLKEVINSNRDLAPTLVWKMGMKEWTPFENIYPDFPPLPMQTPLWGNPFRIPQPMEVPASDISTPLPEASKQQFRQKNESQRLDNLFEISHKNNPGEQKFKTLKEQFQNKKIIIIGGFVCLFIFIYIGWGGNPTKLASDSKIELIKTFRRYENTAMADWVTDRIEDIEDGGMSWSDADKDFLLGGFTKETQNAYRKWRALRLKVENAPK